nr:glutaredoxin family protein [Nocardia nova]
MSVTVLGKPACQQCTATTRKLDKLGVPYTYRDVTDPDDPGAAELVRKLGYTGLPVVTVGDIHWTGFRDARITRLAEIHSGTADIASLDTVAEHYLEENGDA